MKRAAFAAVLAATILIGNPCFGAPLRFEKVSEHCYYLQTKGEAENVFAVVTDEGILLVDPPPEPDLKPMTDALKRLSTKPVRWVAFSGPRLTSSAGARFFTEQGAIFLEGKHIRTLSASNSKPNPKTATASDNSPAEPSFRQMIFDHQIHLFPSNLEVRITAIGTAGNLLFYIPNEKVLFYGSPYEAGRFPEIENSEGLENADEWLESLKQVVDSIRVLKPAIQQTKIDPKIVPEKTLEEGIVVISPRGEASNFQNMKDLLSACQKLRADISKAVKAGRSCDNFLSSSRADTYRSYGNFDSYAAQLCESIESNPEPEPPAK